MNVNQTHRGVVTTFRIEQGTQRRLVCCDTAVSTALNTESAVLLWARFAASTHLVCMDTPTNGWHVGPSDNLGTGDGARTELFAPPAVLEVAGSGNNRWHAFGGDVQFSVAPNRYRVICDLVEAEALAGGPITPISMNNIAYFGRSDGPGASGHGWMTAPLILSRTLTDADIRSYFDDRGQGRAAIFSDPSLVSWLVPESTITYPTDVVQYAYNSDGTASADVTVHGAVSKTRGVNGGFGRVSTVSNTYVVSIPWLAPAGKTVLVGITFDSAAPAAQQNLYGHILTLGGIEALQNAVSGRVSARYRDAAGAIRFIQTLDVASPVGVKRWLVSKVPAGAGGTGRFQEYDQAGLLVQEKSAVILVEIAYNTPALLLTQGGGALGAPQLALIHDWVEVPAVLTDAEVGQVINGTYAGPVSRHITGSESNVRDQVDPNRLWGECSMSGNYADTPPIRMERVLLRPGG